MDKKVLLFYKVYANIALRHNKTNKVARKGTTVAMTVAQSTEIFTSATWNRERSPEELRRYVTKKFASLSDIELEF